MDSDSAREIKQIKKRLSRAEAKPPGTAGSGISLTIEDQDGVPTVANVNTIKVSNGTLTDDGGGVVSLTTAGASTLEVREEDGVPDVSNVTIIRVSNGTLTDNGGGDVSIDTTGTYSLTVKESDGSPSVSDVTTIAFDGATVTNDGGGQVTVTVTGSSGPTLWQPDLPPVSPGGYDDEFSTTNATLDGVSTVSGTWALWDVGGQFAYDPYTDEWGAVFEVTGATPQTAAALYQTFPGAPGDFAIITKISLQANIYGVLNDEYTAGLIIGEDFVGAPATSEAITWGITKYTGSGDWSIRSEFFSDYQTHSNNQNWPATGLSDAMYLRIRHDYDSGTPANSLLWFDWSTNGLAWITVGSITRLWAPLNIGIFATDALGTAGMVAVASFFRYTTTVSLLNIPLYGRRA